MSYIWKFTGDLEKSNLTVGLLVKHLKGEKKYGGHKIPLADAERIANEKVYN
ncbi:MAG: hypothetical protein AABY84_08400 [Candidatus Firestonebacteria bacterium]